MGFIRLELQGSQPNRPGDHVTKRDPDPKSDRALLSGADDVNIVQRESRILLEVLLCQLNLCVEIWLRIQSGMSVGSRSR
jgi:hypothetical protein